MGGGRDQRRFEGITKLVADFEGDEECGLRETACVLEFFAGKLGWVI
jgi:hypothetical protein